jgi:hypothetical protein
MKENQITLPGLTLKAIIVHTVTYTVVGLVALNLFNYASNFAQADMRTWLRQTTDPMVALGPALQSIRGILFALAFYPLREILFGRKNGWLVTWLLLVSLGIFSTFGPTPGSVEGAIYLTLPVREQFITGGMLEVLTQSFLLSGILYYWVNHPEKRWLNWALGLMFLLAVLISAMGYLAAIGYITVPA